MKLIINEIQQETAETNFDQNQAMITQARNMYFMGTRQSMEIMASHIVILENALMSAKSKLAELETISRELIATIPTEGL